MQQVACQQEALSVFDPFEEQLGQLVTSDGIESVERLVENQEFRIVSDRLRDLGALPHAQGIGSNRPLHGVLHADEFECGLCSPGCLGRIEAMQSDEVLHPIERGDVR